MATIKDVAQYANVSIATVSRVINQSPKASQKAIIAVTNAMKTLGYRPNANAQALVSQSTKTIGVVVGNVAEPFFGSMIQTIETIAKNEGRHLLFSNGYHDPKMEKEAIELLIQHRCDALIVHSKALDDKSLIQLANEFPNFILINRYIEEIKQQCVYFDNRFGAFLATECLIKQGHQQIGYICSNHQIEDSYSRLQGYQDALNQYGLSSHQTQIAYGSPDQIGGEQAAKQLLDHSAPSLSAIACYNDAMAAGVLAYCEDQGLKIPQDISLVGFDHGLIGQYIRPKLTSIYYPIKEMAEYATQKALKMVKEENKPEQQNSFQPQLILGHSTSLKK